MLQVENKGKQNEKHEEFLVPPPADDFLSRVAWILKIEKGSLLYVGMQVKSEIQIFRLQLH